MLRRSNMQNDHTRFRTKRAHIVTRMEFRQRLFQLATFGNQGPARLVLRQAPELGADRDRQKRSFKYRHQWFVRDPYVGEC
jgi:hypothetical protein